MNAPASPMNVIWIFGDQRRAQALSINGDPNLNTTNIDVLARTGMNFNQAVCGFPLCCPFRGSLLTSLYPHQCVPGHEYQMPPETPTIAHAFNDAGYDTAWFGKWHVDGFHESQGRAAMHIVPPERRGGFKTWVGYENNNSQWDSWVHGGQGEQAFHYRLDGYETDCLTDLLIDYLQDKAARPGQPFFAALSVQPPHDPYVAPPAFHEMFTPANLQMRPNVPDIPRVQEKARTELAGAYAQIQNLDWNVGRIVETLRELGLDETTHVMFFSDHGDMHGSHGQFKKTSPLEESLRIPMILAGPASRYDYRVGSCNAVMNHVDIAPTTLGLCGLDVPEDMAGFDYSGQRLGVTTEAEPDSAYIQCVIPTGHGDSVDRPWRGVVTRDGWKYVCLESQPWMLFNLNEDPFEQANLAFNTLYARQRKKLHDRLAQWIADTEDHFELPQF